MTRARRDTLVLCYHAISARWPADLAITPGRFCEQLDWLVARGYRGVTFSEAVAGQPAGRTVAITFDDAFGSVLEHATGAMASLGLPGTVFVVTDFADSGRPLRWPGIDHWGGGEHDGELQGMSWGDLARLESTGWEIGTHTRTHPHLTQLPDDALAAELRGSRAACERALGHAVSSIAYPYGDVDARVVRATAAAGYAAGAGLPAVMGRPTALDWPRVGIYRPDALARFRLKVAPAVRRVRTAAAPLERLARARL